MTSLLKSRVLTSLFNVACELSQPMSKKISILHGCMVWMEKSITSDRFFYPHHTPMIDTFSCIPFDLPHLTFKEELGIK